MFLWLAGRVFSEISRSDSSLFIGGILSLDEELNRKDWIMPKTDWSQKSLRNDRTASSIPGGLAAGKYFMES